MEHLLRAFFDEIDDFDPGSSTHATRALSLMGQFAQELLGESAGSLDAPTLHRSALHLRSKQAYQFLMTHEHLHGLEAPQEPLESAALWEWVARTGAPIGVDMTLRHLIADPCGERPQRHELPSPQTDVEGSVSLERLLERASTHLLVTPLRDAQRRLRGMFTLEVHAPEAIGRGELWEALVPGLSLMTSIFTPHLILDDSPGSPCPDGTTLEDEWLPVCGPSMTPHMHLAKRFAHQEETLLLSGPSGSGKSQLARWCHHHSARSQGPFEVLDLLTVPEEMQMAELVGWRRGAFTGASRDVEGAVARAQGGTLFLDEIDKLSLKTQAGLLRLLEERTFRVLGEQGGAREAQVRFIVGTNADLWGEVEAGRFREDLYWRIHILPVQLLPLEQRRDEIAGWADFMLERACTALGLERSMGWSVEALRELELADWPGNLRQLDNVVRRAFAMATSPPEAVPTVLGRHHVRAALELGGHHGHEERGVRATLREAAHHFAREARARQLSGGPALTLEHAEAFRGLVLKEAAGHQQDYESALEALGHEDTVRHRNHHRMWRRELERLSSLEEVLGSQHQESSS